jgi:UDP-glucose 4-epimerase
MILITGGAGYIGRNIARAVGKEVVLLDDFRNSSRAAARDFTVIEAELSQARVDWSRYEAIVHCAACAYVEESMRDPGLYWWNNVGAAAAFFRDSFGKKVIFSSSCAVYGEPLKVPISEEHPINPVNPYGRTKTACEQLLRDLGTELTVFRYFNAAGHDEDHKPETHLIPNVLMAALNGEPVRVFGDGSCVRDYVHVEDLARAHVLALEAPPGVYNLGSGKGATILEVIECARRVTGKRIAVAPMPARPGDPKMLVADPTRAKRELGWHPRHTLETILADSYEWLKAHPQGYPR